MLDEVRGQANQFDILHFHLDLIHFPFFEKMAQRTVTTLHGRLDLSDLADVYRRWPNFHWWPFRIPEKLPPAR